MATFARLKGKTASMIGSLDVTTDATLLGEWANEGVRDVLLRTGVKVATDTIALVADTADYTLATDVILIKHAYVDGDSADHMLTQVGSGELLEMRVRGSAVSSADGPWYYSLEGNDLFRVYPTPTDSGTINLTVVPKPTEMSADANDPANATYGGIPTEFHRAIEMYMLWRAADYDDDASSAQGERYREQYERELKLIRRYVNQKGNVVLPRAKVGRRRYVPRDNSADWPY